jgi:DNA mismatch repair protein MutS
MTKLLEEYISSDEETIEKIMQYKPLSQEYIELYNEYKKVYTKPYILYQVGKFYESYETHNEGPDLTKISQEINVQKTRKGDKTSPIPTYSSPYMLGFPIANLSDRLDLLMENNYTVIQYDQTGTTVVETVLKQGKKIKIEKEQRKMTRIYTKSTYIDNIENKDGNYMVVAYIVREEQKFSDSLLSIGMTGIDLSTGQIYIHESYSLKCDKHYALDELSRFMNGINVKETIVYYQNNTKNDQFNKSDKLLILKYLELGDDSCRFYDIIDKKYKKLAFQNEIIGNVYPVNIASISPIEHIDIGQYIYAIVSLVIAFDFVFDKNKNLLNNLQKPEQFVKNKHMLLGNNAVYQLNMFENKSIDTTNVKYKSLFHIINKTSTALGERYLKKMLLSPLTNETKLNKIYSDVELLLNNRLWEKIEPFLAEIKDIEKIQRKMRVGIIKPNELFLLISSYDKIIELMEVLYNTNKIKSLIQNDKLIDKIKKFIIYVKKMFDLNELKQYYNYEIKTSIYNKEVHIDIDKHKENSDVEADFLNNIKKELDKYIKSTSSNIIKICKEIKKNKRKKEIIYYFKIPTQKMGDIKKKLIELKELEINTIKIKTADIVYKEINTNTHIYLPMIENDKNKYDEIFQNLNKKYFLEDTMKMHLNNCDLFSECDVFIAYLDYIKNSAKIATLYGYTRPIISKDDNYENSYICSTNMRHPIVERLIDYEYVPHDIEIGHKELKGMLIFGVNSSGKSILMKTTGLCIIMAQAGLFVPADVFYYYPYEALYTRITGNDDLLKGLSSFMLEMVELNSILKRDNKNTLIIGDEVCRGTDNISATALVASAIVHLSKQKLSFIFATHLHDILSVKVIKELTNVQSYHLEVVNDKKTGDLIYNRTLQDGPGDPHYGIIVAKSIIQNNEYIDLACKIKNELIESYDSMISGKKSKYNSEIYIYKCNLCGERDKKSHISNLETHHINFQKDCDNDDFVKNKKHLKKNDKANLIVLCTKCHDKIHNNKIKLNGYISTSAGKKLLLN